MLLFLFLCSMCVCVFLYHSATNIATKHFVCLVERYLAVNEIGFKVDNNKIFVYLTCRAYILIEHHIKPLCIFPSSFVYSLVCSIPVYFLFFLLSFILCSVVLFLRFVLSQNKGSCLRFIIYAEYANRTQQHQSMAQHMKRIQNVMAAESQGSTITRSVESAGQTQYLLDFKKRIRK